MFNYIYRYRRVFGVVLAVAMCFCIATAPPLRAKAAAIPAATWLIFAGGALVAAVLSAYGLSQTGPEWESYCDEIALDANAAIRNGDLMGDTNVAPLLNFTVVKGGLPGMQDPQHGNTSIPVALLLYILKAADRLGLLNGSLTLRDAPVPAVGDYIFPVSGTLQRLMLIAGVNLVDYENWAAVSGFIPASTYILCRSSSGWTFVPWTNPVETFVVTAVSNSYVTTAAPSYTRDGALGFYNGSFSTSLPTFAMTQFCSPSRAASLNAVHPVYGVVVGGSLVPSDSLPSVGDSISIADLAVGSFASLCYLVGADPASYSGSVDTSGTFVLQTSYQGSSTDGYYYNYAFRRFNASLDAVVISRVDGRVAYTDSYFLSVPSPSHDDILYFSHTGTWSVMRSSSFPRSFVLLDEPLAVNALVLASRVGLSGVGLQDGATDKPADSGSSALSDFVSSAVHGFADWINAITYDIGGIHIDGVPLTVGSGNNAMTSQNADDAREGATNPDAVTNAANQAQAAEDAAISAGNLDVLLPMFPDALKPSGLYKFRLWLYERFCAIFPWLPASVYPVVLAGLVLPIVALIFRIVMLFVPFVG